MIFKIFNICIINYGWKEVRNILKVKINIKLKIISNDDKGVGVEVDNIWKWNMG